MAKRTFDKDTRYLTDRGNVTSLFRSALEEVLTAHSEASYFWAPRRRKPLSDYEIREVHIVGSILRGNDESDLDIMLIASNIDQEDYRFLKMVLAQSFFSNRPKTQAIDVFVRPYDEFPERDSYEVTAQVGSILRKHNRLLE